MSAQAEKTALDISKEKNKWILVVILSVLLIAVLFYNLILPKSGGEISALQKQENPVGVDEENLNSFFQKELIPSLQALTYQDENTNNTVYPLVEDIFAFAPRSGGPKGNIQSRSVGKDGFVLQGTIIDGDNSVAFLNDQVLGLGEQTQKPSTRQCFGGFCVCSRYLLPRGKMRSCGSEFLPEVGTVLG